MHYSNRILKIGLAITSCEGLLLVKKRGAASYILPGGKPENGEDNVATLKREIMEELGCDLREKSLRYIGTFNDDAADLLGKSVTVILYSGDIKGNPEPKSEIEELCWYSRNHQPCGKIAPSLRNSILPFLSKTGYLHNEISA